MSTAVSVSSEVRRQKDDDNIRRKAHKRLSRLQAGEKTEAKNAAMNTADLYAKGWKANSFSPPDSMAVSYDIASSDCTSSKGSAKETGGVIETAVKRGLNRGLSERNERSNVAGSVFRDDVSDFDLTTITEDVLTSTTGDNRSILRRARKKNSRKSKRKSLECLSKELTHDAWMCGVCGRAFSSLDAADKHEEQHIRDVVAGLGWSGEDNSNANFFSAWSHSCSEKKTFPSGMNGNMHRNNFARPRKTSDDHRVTFQGDITENSDIFESPYARKPRGVRRMNSAPGAPHTDYFHGSHDKDQDEESLLLSNTMKQAIVLADEALVTVCSRAEKLILTQAEIEAERDLQLLSNDKAYYDLIAERTLTRQRNPASRFRSEGKTILSKVQNKFVDAYQLMKEGDPKGMTSDQYNRKRTGEDDSDHIITHDDKTLYVNVMVKNSIQVVSHELERLAKQRWEDAHQVGSSRFERFRAMAHGNFVKLAGLALASDFTPRRIAIQLSNDLYQLLKPRMKRRGIDIETEIEYRVGPYFVLAVNIRSIDWGKLLKATHKDVAARNSRWKAMQKQKSSFDEKNRGVWETEQSEFQKQFQLLCHFTSLTKFDMIAQVLAWLYHCHWIIYYPICCLYYYTFLGSTIRSFIISSVTDEIFFYVEEKGMEMEIEVRKAKRQAAFMLSALRELRADDRALKKKRQETESAEKGTVLGPLLGPAIKQDKEEPEIPPDFEMPDNLEDVGLELDLPVGFRRLRWALLSSESEFLKEAVFRTECHYDDITFGCWSKHDEHIGAPELPPDVNQEDFVGAEKETSYLMPKSAFVSANMCYETNKIEMYNDYVFCLKKVASNPDVPYGKTFKAWTQFLVINTGNNTCRLICSVEAEFPNGPPLVSRQIKSGMRAGTGELFVKVGETISAYSQEYP